MTKEALKLLVHEMEYVLSCINEDKIPFDGDDFHEALRLGKEALAQPEQEKERCVGCEACIDTACGRDECPKGWPKAAQPEQEPVAFINVEQRKLEWAKYMTWDTPTVVNLPKIPLYTTPPQRTWVDLTDEQMWNAYTGGSDIINLDYAKSILKLFKEKNNG